ncbi:MAG: anthranilate synthase component I family protein [Balneolaceae bacterium]
MKSTTSKNSVDFFTDRFGRGELIVLESQLPGHPSSGKSFLAAKPVSSVCAYGKKIIIRENGTKKVFTMDPWEALKNYQSDKKNWLFGYLGYDLKNYLEKMNSVNPALVNTPDFYFMEPSVLVQFEDGKAETILGDVPPDSENEPKPAAGTLKNIRPGIEKEEYIRNIKKIKERIKEGDFYELNYTFPLVGEYQGDPYWLYSKMRDINPVPFGGFLRHDSFSVCCASPERFLKKSGRRIVSEPIKGTSARSERPDDDRYFRDLLMNEKNRAENLMIVDLVRHDLSKVATPGSVTVPKLYDVQSFGTVHQLISTVEARASKGVDSVDIIRACFPMGSMTGAPKIKVMETIDELENYKRGIYSGAIGYFKPNGDFDFNVVIRSAIIQGEKLVYPVGGAITSDSDPEEEWEETEIKSRNITGVFQNHQ